MALPKYVVPMRLKPEVGPFGAISHALIADLRNTYGDRAVGTRKQRRAHRNRRRGLGNRYVTDGNNGVCV